MRGLVIRTRLALAIGALISGACWPTSASAQPVEQERLEAAMAVQLLSFVEWPAQAVGPLVIGILEDPSLLADFETLLEDPLYQGRYAARLVDADDPLPAVADLHALFIPDNAPRDVPRILRRLESQPILLMGSFDGYLEMGGMVNLTRKQKRLGFEINLASARAHGIGFRAKLLRLATRIIEE